MYEETVDIDMVSVYMTGDKLLGYLTIALNFENVDEVREHIINAISESGIKYGVDEALVEQLCMEGKSVSHVLIAEATNAVDGLDSVITYHFDVDHHVAPRTNEDGSVDYHDMGFTLSAKKDDLLISMTAETKGTDGIDLEGNLIQSIDGRPARIKVGKNCYTSDDGLNIYASLEGAIIFDDNKIAISNIIDISGDVGVGTGDIKFNGEVVVHGNVSSGMTVKCNKLTVDGLIEDAKVTVSGNLDVAKGIQGHHNSVVNCLGDVHCKYINNAQLYAHGSIYADVIINSDVRCNKEIKADGKKGCIIGGKIFSKGNVSAKTIGSEMGVTTIFELGEYTSLISEMEQVSADLKELEEALVKTEQCLMLLEQKINEQPNNSKYRELKIQYTRNKFMTQHEISKKNDRHKSMNSHISKTGIITLSSNVMHPGIHITMGHEHLDIYEEKRECVIRSIRGELLVDENRI